MQKALIGIDFSGYGRNLERVVFMPGTECSEPTDMMILAILLVLPVLARAASGGGREISLALPRGPDVYLPNGWFFVGNVVSNKGVARTYAFGAGQLDIIQRAKQSDIEDAIESLEDLVKKLCEYVTNAGHKCTATVRVNPDENYSAGK